MDFLAQVNLKRELTYPICLELLTEPLSLDVATPSAEIASLQRTGTHQGGESNCPVCQCRYQLQNL